MKIQPQRCKIRIPASRTICWPVKIRVRATLPSSAPRTPPIFPASLDFLAEWKVDQSPAGARQAVTHAPDPGTPDWRVYGDHDEGKGE